MGISLESKKERKKGIFIAPWYDDKKERKGNLLLPDIMTKKKRKKWKKWKKWKEKKRKGIF